MHVKVTEFSFATRVPRRAKETYFFFLAGGKIIRFEVEFVIPSLCCVCRRQVFVESISVNGAISSDGGLTSCL